LRVVIHASYGLRDMTVRVAWLDDLPHAGRALVRLAGPDARRFLQGTVTADIERLAPDTAVAGALLTVKGKIVTELVVLCASDDAIDLLLPRDIVDETVALLDRHIVMDDVVVTRDLEAVAAIVWDEDDPEVAPAVGVRTIATRHPLPGWLVVGPRTALQAALAEAEPVDADTFERARVESGTPGWRRELLPGFFPPEVGFVYGVAYDKGCYLGQEPLARIHARGQVNRVMVQVVAEAAVDVPVPLKAPERDDAGTWTTAVALPSGACGLAIVRRDFARPGVVLRTADDRAVRVVSGPLGDDPGVRPRT
jgi:folate-binding protein YgfZ